MVACKYDRAYKVEYDGSNSVYRLNYKGVNMSCNSKNEFKNMLRDCGS